jgi:hypothetical protein
MKRVEKAIFFLLDLLLFVTLRVTIVEATFAEVRARAYKKAFVLPTHRIAPSQAQFLYEEQKRADDHVYDKVKQLLLLTSAVAAYLHRDSPHPVLLSLPLLAVILICAVDLSVRVFSVPDYADPDNDPSERQWALDLAKATHENFTRSSFRADLYRAALRWLVIAFSLIIGSSAITGPFVGVARFSTPVAGRAFMEHAESSLKSIECSAASKSKKLQNRQTATMAATPTAPAPSGSAQSGH